MYLPSAAALRLALRLALCPRTATSFICTFSPEIISPLKVLAMVPLATLPPGRWPPGAVGPASSFSESSLRAWFRRPSLPLLSPRRDGPPLLHLRRSEFHGAPTQSYCRYSFRFCLLFAHSML